MTADNRCSVCGLGERYRRSRQCLSCLVARQREARAERRRTGGGIAELRAATRDVLGLVTVAEAAARLRVSRTRVYQLVAAGRLTFAPRQPYESGELLYRSRVERRRKHVAALKRAQKKLEVTP